MKPYYEENGIVLYHGDCRELVSCAELPVDVVIADPPYNETRLSWDRWPDGWPSILGSELNPTLTLWCFGSLRMFLERRDEFAEWRFVQDLVWHKHNGSNCQADRFKRVHECVAQFIRRSTPWGEVYKSPTFTNDASARTIRRKGRPAHWGDIGDHRYESRDGGPRHQRSVIDARSCHGYATNETQKPVGILQPLVEYSCPPGGLVFDAFTGSGSVLVTAKSLGRRAVGFELREDQCEKAARRIEATIRFEPTEPSPALEPGELFSHIDATEVGRE